MNAALETTLAVELFLNENYSFRRNVLNGKVEFLDKPSGSAERLTKSDHADEAWRPLTQEALNSIIRRAKKEQVCEKGSPKTEIVEFVHSEDVPVHNPIGDYLNQLPVWDGQNHIGLLFSRLPGITSEQQGFLATWLLSAVAHWLQMDTLHGNECVPTWCPRVWQDHLLPSAAASPSASVLSGPSEPLEQVRQGNGADEQPAGEPR